MKRFRRLSGYQKGLLLLMAATVIVFAVLYPVTMSRSGYLWRNTILEYSGTEPGARVYSGRYRGETACFTVRGGAVEFQYGDQSYGPYTVRADPAADNGSMKGIAIYCGDVCVYRCTVSYIDKLPLFPADGNSPVVSADSQLSPYWGGGDSVQPTSTEILALLQEPGLERKGQPGVFFLGVLVCGIRPCTRHSSRYCTNSHIRRSSFRCKSPYTYPCNQCRVRCRTPRSRCCCCRSCSDSRRP